jgi:hypothetical protein
VHNSSSGSVTSALVGDAAVMVFGCLTQAAA